MKKILIISPNFQEDRCNEWIDVATKTADLQGIVSYDYISPETPISENVTLYDCLAIKEALLQMDLSLYEGIILIHGTEYIPFTAASLNLLLTHLQIPLVIITQNALLSQKSNYRQECFIGAVVFILQTRLPGVYNVTKNELTKTLEIHYGARISQKAPFDFQYIDIHSGRFGDILNHEFQFKYGSVNPTLKALHSMSREISPMCQAANIMFIRSYRRMPYHYYNFSKNKPDAVLQEVYDLSSILSNEGLNALTSFSEHCKKHDVPFYLCPLTYEDLDYPNLLKPILDNGGTLITTMTVFTAYAKLVYGYGDNRVHEYLHTDYAYESFPYLQPG